MAGDATLTNTLYKTSTKYIKQVIAQLKVIRIMPIGLYVGTSHRCLNTVEVPHILLNAAVLRIKNITPLIFCSCVILFAVSVYIIMVIS